MLVWGKFIDGKTYKEQLFRIDEDPDGKIAKLICDESHVLILTGTILNTFIELLIIFVQNKAKFTVGATIYEA